MTPEDATGGPAFVVTLLAWVVFAVMAVAIVYAGWIALTNWHRIGV